MIGGGSGAAPATTATGTGVVTALGVNTGSAGAFVVNGGALGSPSSAGTIPAFTLGGTVAGGGNQLNNVIIGTTTPLAGAFTTLSATGTSTLAGITATKSSGTVATFTQTGATGYGLVIVPGADTVYDAFGINNAANTLNMIRMFGNGTATFAGGVGIGGAASPGSTGLAVTGTLSATQQISGTQDTSYANATAYLNASDPSLRFNGTANAANKRIYDIEAAGDALRFRSFNDALNSNTVMATITPTGVLVGGTAATLMVQTNSTAPYIYNQADANNSFSIWSSAASGNVQVAIGANTPAGGALSSGDMVFSTFATTWQERMRLTNSGNLLVGTTSQLSGGDYGDNQIQSSQGNGGRASLVVYNSNAADAATAINTIKNSATTTSSQRFIQFYANAGATAMGGIVGNGASNAQFAALSDVREKTNIQPISGSLDKISALKPVAFDWIQSGEHVKSGFIAQDVEEVFPEFVVENMSGEGEESRKGLTGGMTSGIIPHLVKAIQEQQALITTLNARITALEAK
jgi:hypothetical protein